MCLWCKITLIWDLMWYRTYSYSDTESLQYDLSVYRQWTVKSIMDLYLFWILYRLYICSERVKTEIQKRIGIAHWTQLIMRCQQWRQVVWFSFFFHNWLGLVIGNYKEFLTWVSIFIVQKLRSIVTWCSDVGIFCELIVLINSRN